MKIIKTLTLGSSFLLGFALLPNASATTLFSESFDTDTATTADTLLGYADFSFSGGVERDVTVSGGVLHLSPQGSALNQDFFIAGFAGSLLVEADLGNDPGGVTFNTGLVIGDNHLLFHPGVAGGAFRVEGPGGFANTPMGFTPAAGAVLHHIEVTVLALTGEFLITVTDGDNPANVFNAAFTNPTYIPGDRIGLSTHGFLDAAPRFARFDNFSVTAVPVPASALLLLPALVALVRAPRRQV